MDTSPILPTILVSACRKLVDGRDYDCASRTYLDAVVRAAGGVPLIMPTESGALLDGGLLDRIDGVLLTGSLSNVEPHHYDGEPSSPGTLHDPGRDRTTLPLIEATLRHGIPLLGICRGFQEINVVRGGTLHQRVQELPGMLDHRDDENASLEQRFALVHDIEIEAGGLLDGLAGGRTQPINSLHQQGIDRLGDGLAVEARAPDGLIEAFRVDDATAFALAVQWHPEWEATERPLSKRIFAAFGDACRAHVATRRAG